MFFSPVDSVIGFSTVVPSAISTILFQLWDYLYQQVEEWLVVPLCCWFEDGLLNYTMFHRNSLSEYAPTDSGYDGSCITDKSYLLVYFGSIF